MEDFAIAISGLRKTYAASRRSPVREALKGVDLMIPKGSVFGLLGPNGAGKSTLINILAGLVLKTSGNVRIWGFDQDRNPRQSRAAIGVVPQELNLDAFLTPRETLEMQAGLYGVRPRDRQTDALLAAVGLTDKTHAYSRSLSGGMRRRLLLAKALVHAPQVLVLDEPTAGVDIELRRMLWDYVRNLNARGVTIILTTHYLEEAEAMCDRIAIIDKGRIIAEDTTRSLVTSMDRKTLVVVPDRPLARLPDLPQGIGVDTRADGSLAMTYARADTRVEDLLGALGAAGITIRDIAIEEPKLEDVFVAMTGTR